MDIHVTGVPESLRGEATRLIRDTLGGHPLEGTLHVQASRFHNGEWMVFITDLHEVQFVDGALAERIRRHLQGLSVK